LFGCVIIPLEIERREVTGTKITGTERLGLRATENLS
jgi:hypothetical protein|tara:strand:- start:1507 stop:1617 length:111 start_codon:yes stop_codon:yes gene_type:complete